jgi:hypothetical protein
MESPLFHSDLLTGHEPLSLASFISNELRVRFMESRDAILARVGTMNPLQLSVGRDSVEPWNHAWPEKSGLDGVSYRWGRFMEAESAGASRILVAQMNKLPGGCKAMVSTTEADAAAVSPGHVRGG